MIAVCRLILLRFRPLGVGLLWFPVLLPPVNLVLLFRPPLARRQLVRPSLHLRPLVAILPVRTISARHLAEALTLVLARVPTVL